MLTFLNTGTTSIPIFSSKL